jgi:hypothetical protein
MAMVRTNVSVFLRILVVLAAVAVLLNLTPLYAQVDTGSITGVVTDPSGAVVPGATVIVTNTAMGTKATLKTNQDGYYQAPLLNPGMYQVEASLQGFKKAVRDSVEVRVADVPAAAIQASSVSGAKK